MMNMLVAIMGDTFIKNSYVETQLLLKGKLKFVVDNWWIKTAMGDEKHRIKYIISALISENEDDGNDIVNQLQNEFEQLKMEQRLAHDDILSEIKSIQGL